MKLTYASLFAGIGGFESGINKLGGVNVFASEIDKFARQSYEALYGVEPSGDITKIDSNDIPTHDLLTAGFPCQTFSVAGKRAGMAYVCKECEQEQTISFQQYADRQFVCESCNREIEAVDGRGLLFFEVARVARDKKPKFILLENVKGIVGHDKGRTLDTIVRTLSEIGYVVDFDVLNSKFFGVPQNRERIFIVAVREDIQPHEEWHQESLKGNTVIPKGKRRIAEYEEVKTFNFNFPESDVVTKRLYDVTEAEVDERFYLDDDKTIELVTRLNSEFVQSSSGRGIKVSGSLDTNYESSGRVYSTKGQSPTISARDYKGPKMIVEDLMQVGELRMKGHRSVKAVYSPDGQCPTLTTMGGGHREPKITQQENKKHRIRKLTPKECWRLQGFTDEQHDIVELAGVSNSQRYKQAGNAVTVNVIEAIIGNLIEQYKE